jgi:hypothetical protein
MKGYCSTGQSPQWAVVPMEKKKRRRQLFSSQFQQTPKRLDNVSYNCPTSYSTQISLTVLALFYKRTDGRTKQSSLVLCMDSNASKNKLSHSFDKLFYRIMTSTNQVIRHTHKLEACLHACGHIGDQLHSYDSIVRHNSFSPFIPMWNTAFKLFLLVLTKASTFASFQLFPAFCSAHSIVLFQTVLGLPLYLVPWGF